MRALAYHDLLTGLSNRRQALDELNMLAGNESEAGIVLLHLDEFKMVNDRYGHDIGDRVLIKVAEVLRSVDSRLASRWGGEEFLLIFEGGQAAAVAAAEQLRQRLAAAEFPDGIRLTASFGVSFLAPGAAVSDVLRLADGRSTRRRTTAGTWHGNSMLSSSRDARAARKLSLCRPLTRRLIPARD